MVLKKINPPLYFSFDILRITELLHCAVDCSKRSRNCKIKSAAHLGRLTEVSYLKHMFQMLVRDG